MNVKGPSKLALLSSLSWSLVLRQLRSISATIERCYKQDFFSKISTISFNNPTFLKETEIRVQGGRSFTTKIATLFDSGRTCETYLQPILVADTFFVLQTLSTCKFRTSWPKKRLYTSFESPKRRKIDSVFEDWGRGPKHMADPVKVC